jgi:alpha-galactosidase|tara:strand:- start:1628 stop:2002 length:375 start_codon:yes stop_codon:yes gene_type:complete
MAWFLKLERNGVDAYLNLFEAMDDPQKISMDTVPFEVLRQAEYFVSESTRHMSEYVPYFQGDPIRMERFNLAPFDLGARAQQLRVDAHYETIHEELESDAPMVAQRTNEYAAYIIDSTETGTLK